MDLSLRDSRYSFPVLYRLQRTVASLRHLRELHVYMPTMITSNTVRYLLDIAAPGKVKVKGHGLDWGGLCSADTQRKVLGGASILELLEA